MTTLCSPTWRETSSQARPRTRTRPFDPPSNQDGRFDVPGGFSDGSSACSTSNAPAQEGTIISQNSHHDRFLVRFQDGAERWIPNNELALAPMPDTQRVHNEPSDESQANTHDELGKGGTSSH
jgi:hypothetical protein